MRRISRYEDLDIQGLLGYFGAAVGVLRALETANAKMYYNDFAKAIGLGVDGNWRFKVTNILHTLGALEGVAGAGPRLQRERIVSKESGTPSQGFFKTAKIIVEEDDD